MNEVFDKPSAWSGLESLYGRFLQELMPVHTIVEIGVDYGFSLFTFASDFPDAKVVGIDPYGGALHGDAEAWVMDHVSAFPNVILCKAQSVEANRSWILREQSLPGGDIDLIHLDAQHDYSNVKTYYETWEPLVRPGGVIMFHDVCSFPDDTGRFFIELEGRKSLIQEHHGLGFWFKE